MRIDIDAGVDRYDALDRAKGRKRVGRKHNHQPRGRARDKRLAALKRAAIHREVERRKFNDRVRAYWLGLVDAHPV